MNPTSTVSARATVRYCTNPLFVTYPATSPKVNQSAQAVVLHALTDPTVGPPEHMPLVSATLKPVSEISHRSNTKRSGKNALQLDMGNDLRSLHEVFLPDRSHFPSPHILRRNQVQLDEAYLHSTLSAWEGKSELDKLLITASAMSATTSVAFTVDFSKQRQISLGADLPGAFRKLRNSLSELNSLGAAIATLEIDRKGRLHLHGMVATSESWSVVRKALKPIGGKSGNKKFNARYQIKPKPAHSPLFWAMYITKDLVGMSQTERDKMIYRSQSATQMARVHLAKLNDLAEQKLGCKGEMRGRSAVYSRACKRAGSGRGMVLHVTSCSGSNDRPGRL